MLKKTSDAFVFQITRKQKLQAPNN